MRVYQVGSVETMSVRVKYDVTSALNLVKTNDYRVVISSLLALAASKRPFLPVVIFSAFFRKIT
ncbi:hypothetical protein D3C72_1797360 [compost metagenome]